MMVFLRVVQIKMAAASCFGADPLGPLAVRCALVTAKPECVREGASLSSTGPRPTSSGRNRMASSLRPVTVAPKGMGLYDFVALQEGFFAAEGLDVDLDWKTFRGTQSSWKDLNYFQRPQDQPYTQDKRDVIQGACVWGTICNASAGMGKMVPDAYGISPWAIFVRPDSRIRRPEDLKDVPVSVGMRAGSHFNVPYRLGKYLPLEHIKVGDTGGFGARPKARADGGVGGGGLVARADRDGRAARIAPNHRRYLQDALVGSGRFRAGRRARLSARARARREGHGRGYGEISAALEARGAGGIRELPSVGLFEVRPWRAVLLPHAPARGIRRHPRAGQALGPRSVSQGSRLRDAELFALSPRCRALASGIPLRANRVALALLHVARLCGACEVLLLGVGLTGRRCIPLALRHEALEGRSRELLVSGIRLAGRERGCGRDQADGQRQRDFLHGFLHRQPCEPRGRLI